MRRCSRILVRLSLAVGIAALCGCSDKVDGPMVRAQGEPACRYVMDEDTARLKREFEEEWLKHVAGYTNYTTVGMAEDCADMDRFIKEWKPRILRNQVYKVKDNRLREMMVSRMLKADSIEALYYGLLIPHQEIWDRWSAYDENVNACGKLGEREVRFANGRARWMSDKFDDCEMSAVILEDCVWPIGGHDAFAFVLVNISVLLDGSFIKGASNSLGEYWLCRFQGGVLTWSGKLPVKDVLWEPNLEHAPFGRAYTVIIKDDKANVVNCVSGETVLSCPVGCSCDKAAQKAKINPYDYVVRDADLFLHDFNDFLNAYLDEMRTLFTDKDFLASLCTEGAMPNTREYKSKFDILYTDGRTFFSYRAECYRYTGGAHGGEIVRVGTIDVKTGKRLTIYDVIPEDKYSEAVARVKAAVIAEIGGEENLMPSAAKVLAALPENFYIGKDGLHFIFAEYSVAPYHYAPEKYGPVEVVIPTYGSQGAAGRFR